jgi:predicted O-linked N-acetylglucosamine transferase (SPINDLY family)
VADAAKICRAVLKTAPQSAPALHLAALIAYRQGDTGVAIDILQQALHADPRLAEAHNDLGNLYQMKGDLDEATASYRHALRLRPDYAEAHRNLASALRRLGRLEEAVDALETAVSLDPNLAEAAAQLVHQLKQICDWRRIDGFTARLIAAVESNSAPVNPFIFLSLDTTPAQQLRCARQYAAAHLPPKHATSPARDSEILTIGYLSSDYQEHATAHLISELFELHDRARFRIVGYSYGHDDGSTARRRLAAAFDKFVDLENDSHAKAAARIREDGVHILVDLKGYTAAARPEIVAMRPAPIQVSYLGYPGTMGIDAIDYILADPFVAPFDQQPHFAEKLVHLPNCYQVNDRRRAIAPYIPSRTDCGLPESGVVFCCLSAAYKITAPVFDVWMRLLGSVPESVLWLLHSSPKATENLRREAESRVPGASPRLVFAPSRPNPEHLARLALADVFLDTLPYNAHTLASDAMWACCPIITCAGATFASRVAGSILRAAGLPELVTTSLSEYEALALRLARDPAELRNIRMKLLSNRDTAPLFDTPALTRHIESAYREMWRIHHAGEAPRAFTVAAGGV